MRSGTTLHAAVAALSVAAALPIFSTAGCKHHEEAPVVEPGVTREQLLAEGEHLVRDGMSLRRQGMSLRQSGGGGEDLIIRGEQMIVEGERRKDRAMMKPPATAPQPTRPTL